MSKIKNFRDFVNEASLRGNIGVPGEEGSGRESWIEKTKRRSDVSAREFAAQNRADIANTMGLVSAAKRLQRGHEKELSELTVDVFREVFGYILDGIDLDFKIVTGNETDEALRETPSEPPEETQLEELEDKGIIDQIHKRKILRTIQQGKGLSSKSMLNLSSFKEGLVTIMGREKAAEYLTVLNKLANVMQFHDWSMPDEVMAQMYQRGRGAAGAAKIEFPKEEVENKEDQAKKVLDDLANGEDIVDNENVEELLSGLNIKLTAVGLDLSVLIHEGIKAVYMLITQASLESLYGETAETVIANTDTMLDEVEEIKFGRQMQSAFFKIINEHPEVEQKIQSMLDYEYSDVEIASFQEKLQYLFLSEIAQLGSTEASEMLEVVNAILSESPEAISLCDPIIKQCLKNLESAAEYETWSKSQSSAAQGEPFASKPSDESLSKSEIQNRIDAALDAGDWDEVARLSRLIGESIRYSRKHARLR